MSHFSKIEIFGLLTRNPEFIVFCGVFVNFDTKIFPIGTDIFIPNINNLLELVISFSPICEQILQLALFLQYKIYNICP